MIRDFLSTRTAHGHFSSLSPRPFRCHLLATPGWQCRTGGQTLSQLFVIVIAENIFTVSESSVGFTLVKKEYVTLTNNIHNPSWVTYIRVDHW